MAKARINQKTVARCLLTEIAPYETPTLFSNWGSYNYVQSIKGMKHPAFLKRLFSLNSSSIPFKYKIKKDGLSTRTLSLVHPHNSEKISEFYNRYDVAIIRACKRSRLSLRAPHHVAKFYTFGKNDKAVEDNEIEGITEATAYASSYFAYSRFSHLHKFFDSDEYTELEKRFAQMRHLDIAKFFPSLYTHSVSWAIRGKMRTKNQRFKEKQNQSINQSFDAAFDDLLQQLNFRETHGIPIGPELCRIFAEVILQKVDSTVVERLEEGSLVLGKDYWCYRYIDDFYVFFNEQRSFHAFFKILSEELEKFKLYLNDDKEHVFTRPFISALSVRKLALSAYLKDLFTRRSDLSPQNSSVEINRLRALIKDGEALFSGVSTFLLSSLSRQIRQICRSKSTDEVIQEKLFDVLFVYLELAFHAFQMDIRVATSFKITAIILEVFNSLRRLPRADQARLMDKIVFETRIAFESAFYQGCSVECLNLLIACAVFADQFPLPHELLKQCIEKLKSQHNDEYPATNKQRLGYFETVTLIYYIRDREVYKDLRTAILVEAKQTIADFNPCEYAETAYLLLDLTTCPFLNAAQKDELINCAMKHEPGNQSASDVGYFRNFVSQRSWYFNWTPVRRASVPIEENVTDQPNPYFDLLRHAMLQTHLQKKQLLLSY